MVTRRRTTATITIYVGEHDGATPAAHARLVADQVPDPAQVTYEVVAGAGHYAFLTPFPPEMKRADFPPSADPPGFDRAAFHARLEIDVREFLDRTLAA